MTFRAVALLLSGCCVGSSSDSTFSPIAQTLLKTDPFSFRSARFFYGLIDVLRRMP